MLESEGQIRLNPDIAKVVCSVTGSETDAKEYSQPLALCACCPPPGKPLVVVYELDAIRERLGDSGWGTGPGIWRYGALLPVLGLPWRYAPDVGLTQAVRNESLGGKNGVDLFLKNEGTNPTGSFKDRGLAVGIALGVACGAQGGGGPVLDPPRSPRMPGVHAPGLQGRPLPSGGGALRRRGAFCR